MSKRFFLVASLFNPALIYAASPQLLFDFVHQSPPDFKSNITEDELKRIVPIGFKEKCGTGNEDIHQIQIEQEVEGSFTTGGTKEKAVLLHCNDNMRVGRNNILRELVIYSGDRSVGEYEMGEMGGLYISAVTDLNQDGTNEILIQEGGTFAGGSSLTTAQLLEFKGGLKQVVRDFGTVNEHTCGGRPPGSYFGVIIRYMPLEKGKWPKFLVEEVKDTCE